MLMVFDGSTVVLLCIINANDCQIEKSFNSKKMNRQYAQESLESMLKVEWCRLHPYDDLVHKYWDHNIIKHYDSNCNSTNQMQYAQCYND